MKSILNLQSPVIGLSPMDGITDYATREIVKEYGNPDLIYTEFVNVMGLCIAGFNTLKELEYSELQRPIIGQIYGKEPEYFYHAAKIIAALGFDGVDINMGCPAKNVASSGAGAGLIKTPQLALEIIESVKKGVADWVDNGQLTGLNEKTFKAVDLAIKVKIKEIETIHKPDSKHSAGQINLLAQDNKTKHQRVLIPVSVKTRIGYDKPITEQWISTLDSANPSWIAVHGRLLKQMYSGFADRNELKKAVNSTSKAVLINGDLLNRQDALKAIQETGAFGALIGRGSFGNPWVFKDINLDNIPLNERLKVMIKHTNLFVQKNGDPKAFVQMRKHFGWYIKGFDGAREARTKLMTANSITEVQNIINQLIN